MANDDRRRGADDIVVLRLTHKFAEMIDGVDLHAFHRAILALRPHDARCSWLKGGPSSRSPEGTADIAGDTSLRAVVPAISCRRAAEGVNWQTCGFAAVFTNHACSKSRRRP
jgi:hypothetical protein